MRILEHNPSVHPIDYFKYYITHTSSTQSYFVDFSVYPAIIRLKFAAIRPADYYAFLRSLFCFFMNILIFQPTGCRIIWKLKLLLEVKQT